MSFRLDQTSAPTASDSMATPGNCVHSEASTLSAFEIACSGVWLSIQKLSCLDAATVRVTPEDP